jgi:hypothetical protein
MMMWAYDTVRVSYRLSLGTNQTGKAIDSDEIPPIYNIAHNGSDYAYLKKNWRTKELNET